MGSRVSSETFRNQFAGSPGSLVRSVRRRTRTVSWTANAGPAPNRDQRADLRAPRRDHDRILEHFCPPRARIAVDGRDLPLRLRAAGPWSAGARRGPPFWGAIVARSPVRDWCRHLPRCRSPVLESLDRGCWGGAGDGAREHPGCDRAAGRMGGPRRASGTAGARGAADRAARRAPHLGCARARSVWPGSGARDALWSVRRHHLRRVSHAAQARRDRSAAAGGPAVRCHRVERRHLHDRGRHHGRRRTSSRVGRVPAGCSFWRSARRSLVGS